ncbi:MAG: succinylglutamate desuccinylase/aspartoacylase family protein [Clostridium sp.]|nr:succinylglutamate desuccinylase/aspartoacylase family protein [Clostridium sp.]
MIKELDAYELKISIEEKVRGYLKIIDTGLKVPVTIINGKKPGKTIVITSGVHGCEYEGIKAAMELSEEINPREVSGKIIIFHPINISAFESRSAGIVPEDKKNLLRVFPGNKNGTVSEKIAYVLSNEFLKEADYYLDIHGGDVYEDLIPHIYYPGKAKESIIKESIELAKAFDVKYYIKSNTTNGTYTSAAINYDVPSILIERGCLGVCGEEDVKAYKKDILNALIELNILSGEKTIKDFSPQEITDARYIDSKNSGCWIRYVKAGDNIKKGQKLGEIKDYFGQLIDTCYAEFDGVVLYNTAAFYVDKGSSLVAYGKI